MNEHEKKIFHFLRNWSFGVGGKVMGLLVKRGVGTVALFFKVVPLYVRSNTRESEHFCWMDVKMGSSIKKGR